MSETVQASNGEMLPLPSLPQTFTYDGDFIAAIDLDYAGKHYQQVFVNNGSRITYASNWNYVPVGAELIYDESGALILTDDTNQPIYTG